MNVAFAESNGQPITRKIRITPSMAANLAAKNNNNRNMIRSVVKRYADDMVNGRWLFTHAGIAFDKAGNLIDGQHRLQAIIESNIAIEMNVTWGLDEKVILAVDRGKARSLADNLKIRGHSINSNKACAVAKRMYLGPKNHKYGLLISDGEMFDFVTKHRDAIEFAMATRAREIAGLGGAIARAFYHVPKEKLIQFSAAMKDDISPDKQFPGCRTARTLDRALLLLGRQGGNSGTEMYHKCQNAIRLFMNGQDVVNMRACDEDLYPLPE